MSSVKDRLACAIIEDAEKTGKLKPGDTVIEALGFRKRRVVGKSVQSRVAGSLGVNPHCDYKGIPSLYWGG